MNRFVTLLLFLVTLPPVGSAWGGEISAAPKVLFFSKAASWEQKIVHRDGDQLSYLEQALQGLGQANAIDFTFSKDGTFFTAENLARFDAFFFFTSGDLTFQQRNGRGDNYPLMTLQGKRAFLDAIHNGKGFIGCNTANYTFPDGISPGEKKDAAAAGRYTRMLGAGYMGHNEIQRGYFSYLDRAFPGLETVPADYCPVDQWYAFNKLMPDMHVIMALDAGRLAGNLYQRPSFPIAWARMEGKGRVFYTTMGHTAEIWKDPVFLRMLLGGIRWATGRVNADIAPNMAQATPHANDIPQPAAAYVAANPPLPNPHFPNFKVHFPDLKARADAAARAAPKRVLFFTRSAGYEHPVAYREGANVCFLEREMLEFAAAGNFDFVFSKDPTLFTPENLAQYDAFLFYTSGDLTNQPRNGLGDNYPLMTPQGKEAFLQAIRQGKGFVGVHCAIDTFSRAATAAAAGDASQTDPYACMLGAACAGCSRAAQVRLTAVDARFPGMEHFPAGFTATNERYALQHLQADLHVILAGDYGPATGGAGRPAEIPLAWARMEGKGRVFYTALGHDEQTWQNPVFQQMLRGALRWTTGVVEADVKPGAGQATNRKAPKPPAEYPLPAAAASAGPIPIDIGRQLFVDDYLIQHTTLTRTFHQAKLHPDAPVLKPETKLEIEGGTAEGAVLFDGGVWHDPQDGLFKMWYAGGFRDGICYATSRDGLHWQRPALDVSPGENRVLPYHKGWQLDGFSVALDPYAQDPTQRFKMLAYHRYQNRFPGDQGQENPPAKMYVSADGIHWGEPQMVKCFVGDNAAMFYDPFRKYWVFSTRNRAPSVLRPGAMGSNGKPVTVRARFRFDGPDFLQTGLTANKALLWLTPDQQDKADPELRIDPELYKFGAVAYESLMLGAYGMFFGPQNDVAKVQKRPKIIDIQLGFSRDGVTYPRPCREAFIAAARAPGTWNRGYLHSANGVCLIVGDELWFYFGAWSGLSRRPAADYVMAGGSVGLATLRRDGFASLDAGDAPGSITTKALTFSGQYLFVNVAAPQGRLRAEVLDDAGRPIEPFTLGNCQPLGVDCTRQRLAWKGADNLAAVAGRPVRLRFELTDGKLYAFWITSDARGASHGYVAAGGPAFAGPTDR